MAKKTITFLLVFGLILSLYACFSVNAEETTTISTETTATTTVTTTTVDESIKTYQYTDFDDLVNQIYADVYAQIYAELYAEYSETIFIDPEQLELNIYEEIYAQVEAQLWAQIETGNITVVMDDFLDQLLNVADITNHSVIGVSTFNNSEGISLGSGVIYYFDELHNIYYLITNHHVVDGGNNFKVVFADGTEVTATLLGADEDIDIAILSFEGDELDQDIVVSILGNSDVLTQGTIVLASGNPRGYNFFGSMTMGIVAGVNRIIDDNTNPYIQHDAAINSGNSGGPLYNLCGEVVGINVSKYAITDIEGMGFAIPINLVKTVIEAYAPNTIE
ncbi:MAG: trypsin-like peptidase domain-containing protein [Candidatus Izemoplasmatales bacterium]